LNRRRRFFCFGLRRCFLALGMVIAALPAVVAPATAGGTHTLGNTTTDGKGEQFNVQGLNGGGGNGTTHEGCIQMTQLRFAAVYLTGGISNNSAHLGTTHDTSTSPIEGVVTVEEATNLYEGPHGTYDLSSPPGPMGCEISKAGAAVSVDKITATFHQGQNPICADTPSTTGTIQRGSSGTTGHAEFVLTGVKCAPASGVNPHSYNMRVLITQLLAQTPNFGVCVAPAAPNTCNILASQLAGV